VRYVLQGLGALFVLATILPFLKSEKWWIRIFDYPRAQIATAIAIVLGLYALAFGPAGAPDHVLIVALLIALGAQLVQIFPYTPLARPQTQESGAILPERGLRILLANVLMHNRRADELLAIIDEADPDILLAVETDDWWDRQLVPLEARYPHSVRCPLPNTYGLHLFSRLELRETSLRYLVEPDVPSVRTDIRLRSGDWIAFWGVHPRPPQPAQDTEQRDAELLIVGREARESALPAVVGGDLNDVAWSHTTRLFQRISGLLDPRIGRGLYATFPAQIPFFCWPLDHLFHGASFTLFELRRLPYFGSDHFPILIGLVFEPAAAGATEVPTPAPGDRAEAVRKILKGVPKGARARLKHLMAEGRRRAAQRRRRRSRADQ
jgi:endonuclease/exonuclease/phosphatase (EEP) superfamily protein YafD